MASEEIKATLPPVSGGSSVVGVFGYPVAHSLSPAMHNAAFAALSLSFIYVPFSVAPENLGTALRGLTALGIVGVNLTIPHKVAALAFLDEITEEARDVGAVNTVSCKDGRLVGDNTDGRGFYQPLRERGLSLRGKSAVVLGAGGAARSVVYRLVREGAQVWLANRTLERAEQLARDVAESGLGTNSVHPLVWESADTLAPALAESELLVQTTRVGMHPDESSMPLVPLAALHPDLLVYDLVYNPLNTVLLKEAQQRGCPTLTGVKMLVYQGAFAFQNWTGIWPPTNIMEAAVLSRLR